MFYLLAIILAILATAGQAVICWRGVKNSANITNPFPELPDDAFRKCADMVKKRYILFFSCCLVILISLILFYTGASQRSGILYVLGIFGIFLGIGFLAFGSFERRKTEEILEAHKHDWKDFTQAIAAHKI
jgi:hypothetical protein